MEIVPLTPLLHAEWNALVDDSDDAWMFHRAEFLTNIMEPTWGGTPYHFLVRDHGRFIALCPLVLQTSKRKILRRSYFLSTFGCGGPVVRNDCSSELRNAVLQFIFVHISTLATQTGAEFYRFSFPPTLPARSVPFIGMEIPHLRDESTATIVIDLTSSLAVLFAAFTARSQRAIRQAERAGVRITEIKNAVDIRTYYRIHKETYHRTGAQVHPPSYFSQIWSTLTPNGIAHFFFAKKSKATLGCLNMAAYKQHCLYWTGCSTATGMSLRVNNLLQWHAIRWAKEHGFASYEVGEVFPTVTQGKLHGLTQFKQSFGGTAVPFYKYVITYRPWRSKLFALLRRFRR